LKARINLFAHHHLDPLDNGHVEFASLDRREQVELETTSALPLEGELILHRAVYNRWVNQFNGARPLPVGLTIDESSC